MFGIWLLGCAGEAPPAAPPRPAIGVAVPLTGPDATLGEAALAGARLAAGAEVDVIAIDDGQPGAAAALAANPVVIGAVAHVQRRAAEQQASSWLATDVPTVVAAPGDHRGLPRVVPPIEASARCAKTFLAEEFWVRTDGSTPGMVAARTLAQAVPELALGTDTVDGAHVSSAAARVVDHNEAAVAWTGDAAAGGNFLRAVRQIGSNAPFLGVGLYDPRFLAAAGSSAEGARVTAEGRPARAQAFVDAFTARTGAPPSGPAVDAYEAATLLVAAWRTASETTRAKGAPLTRADVREALRSVVAEGANGPMYLDGDGVLQPVLCAAFVVRGGRFELERIASEADPLVGEPAPAAEAAD